MLLHFIPWPTVCEWHWIWFSLPSSRIAFHPMTNREWVTLYLFFFTIQSHCISSHDQQYVSDTSFGFLYHAVSFHFIPRPIGSEWHCICSYLPCSLIAFHLMTNRMWVTLHLFFFTMQSHSISSHDQQGVSDAAFFFLYHAISLHYIPWPTGSEWLSIVFIYHVAFHPTNNRLWVTPHFILYHVDFIWWPTGCEQHWIILFTMQCHCINLLTASEWLCILFYHVISLHPRMWWHYSSLHLEIYGSIMLNEQQEVSNIFLFSQT